MYMKISRDDLRRLIREEMSGLLETQTASDNPMMSAETQFSKGTPRPYITGVVTSKDTPNLTLANPLGKITKSSTAEEIFANLHGITTDDYRISCTEEPPGLGRWSCEAKRDEDAMMKATGAGEEGLPGMATT